MKREEPGRSWRYWGSDWGMSRVRGEFLYGSYFFPVGRSPYKEEMDDAIENENMDRSEILEEARGVRYRV